MTAGVLATLAVAASLPNFTAAFPDAAVVLSRSGNYLTLASGLQARGFGDNPESAASAFLAKYGPVF